MKPQFQELPYGFWLLGDGSFILFNRRYEIIGKRLPDGTVIFPEKKEWQSDIVFQVWFYNDACTPEKHRKLAEHLARLRDGFIKIGKKEEEAA